MTDVYVAPVESPVEKPVEKVKAPVSLGNMIDAVLERTGEVRGKSLVGAYCVAPGKRFIDEQEDEEVVLLLRAHPITNLKWIFVAVLMIIFPQLLSWVGMFNGFPPGYVMIGLLSWYLVIVAFVMEKFLDWYYSVFIVTNERVVDINFENLLSRQISFANLNHIEAPSMIAGGFFRSLFSYGDVFIATAAEEAPLSALGVPYPDKVISIISELQEELEKRIEKGDA